MTAAAPAQTTAPSCLEADFHDHAIVIADATSRTLATNVDTATAAVVSVASTNALGGT
jgi:phosphoserine aminotransferase